MPICRYFQEGRCRFGERCWNEHPGYQYAGANRATHWVSPLLNYPVATSRGYNQNPVYFQNTEYNNNSEKNVKLYENCERAKGQSNIKNNSQFNSFPSESKKETHLTVKQDIESWEKEHIWPFSCYTHFENKEACFPGFADISPEELRYKAYEAEKRNNFPSYEAAVATIFCDVKEKWNVLKQSSSSYIESIQPEFHLNHSLCPDSIKDFICHDEKEFSDNASDNMQTEHPRFSNKLSSASNSLKLTHLSSANPPTISSESTFRFVLPSDEEMRTESGSFGALLEFGRSQSSKQHSYPVLSSSTALLETQAATMALSQTEAINSNYTPLECLTEEEKLQFCALTFTLGEIPTRPPCFEMCF